MPPTRRQTAVRANPTHAEIITPGWRPYVSSRPIPDEEKSISSDDTDEEAYLKMHQPCAVRERETWAGPKSGASKSEKKAGAKRTRPVKPMFPTPQECFEGMLNGWRSYQTQTHLPRDRANTTEAKRRALTAFEPIVDSFAHIEYQLNLQSHTLDGMKRRLQEQGGRVEGSGRRGRRNGHVRHDRNTMFEINTDSLRKVMNGRNGVVGGAGTVNGAHRDSSINADAAAIEMTETALRTLQELEEIFNQKSSVLLNAIQSIAQQGQCKIRDSQSFCVLKKDFAAIRKQVKQMNDGNDSEEDSENGGGLSLANCIKREINASKYPVLAQRFCMRPEYRLDGAPSGDEREARRNESDLALRHSRENGHIHIVNGSANDDDDVESGTDEEDRYYPEEAEDDWKPAVSSAQDRRRLIASPARQSGLNVPSHQPSPSPKREHILVKADSRSAPRSRRDKTEGKSYRITEDPIESITSGPSDIQQDPSRSLARTPTSQIQSSRRAPPRRFQYVYDVDGNDMLNVARAEQNESDDNAGSDYSPAVVDLDSDH